MERLWASWRTAYILGEAEHKGKKPACIFCDLPAEGLQKYRANLILSVGTKAMIIMNRYPYNNGHLMVVPRSHVNDPSFIPDDEYHVVTEVLRVATAALRKESLPDGLNLGMNIGRTSGAGIEDHCHYHIVPRWDGDTNFMPVLGDTKVISEGLFESYDRLFPSMKDIVATVEKKVLGL